MNQASRVLPITRCRIAGEELSELIATGLEEHPQATRTLALEALAACLELQAALTPSPAHTDKEKVT